MLVNYLLHPFWKKEFGGTEKDLETVISYRLTMKVLEVKLETDKGQSTPIEEEQDAERKARRARRPWWKKKGEEAAGMLQ